MKLEEMLRLSYELLPPPLAALPAKYHAPVSLLIHSLSTGIIAHDIARLADLGDYEDVAFILGLTHDIHQKLVEDGLSTLRTSKEYIRNKLDKLGFNEYYRYVDDALDVDACGKSTPIRDLPKELSTVCHIGDVAQGRLDALALLNWLCEKVREVKKELTVRFYSVMIPQPFARSYIMYKIYEKYISKLAGSGHVALASRWGLYVIAYEDELPEVLEVSWDELRIDDFPAEYEDIKAAEVDTRAKEKLKKVIDASNNEIKEKAWLKFARMFFSPSKLGGDKPLYPELPSSIMGMFVGIKFTDMKFKDNSDELHTCPLCGIIHSKEQSFGVNIYPKVAKVDVTTEKWNRRLPGHIKVRGWEGQWRHGYGLDPLCVLDAVAVREFKLTGLNGVVLVSISKPVPIWLISWVAIVSQHRKDYRRNPEDIPTSALRVDELSKVGGVVVDYVTATVSVPGVGEPVTDNMFEHGELSNIGFLIAHGFYPIKYFEAPDFSLPDRLFVTAHTYPLIDFPVTAEGYRNLIPWVAKLLQLAGEMEKSKGIEVLHTKPDHAPLRLLSLNKEAYTNVLSLLSQIGVRT